LLELTVRENAASPDPNLGHGMVSEFERQCSDGAWSVARRRCLGDAREQDETSRCPQN
jgi:hypothetical protein